MKRIAAEFTTYSMALAMLLPAACLGPLGGGGGGGGRDGSGQCVPDVDTPDEPVEYDPECEACVSRSCSFDDDCSDPCESYFECTCECDGEDTACFSACENDKTPSCTMCQEESGEQLFSCVQDECAEACGLGAASGGFPGGDDDGGPSGDDGWPGGDDGDAGGDDGGPSDDGGWPGDDGGEDTSGDDAVCDELKSQCCPNLSGVDRDLCEGASTAFECELWLDIFRDEGSC